jgi:hypothetical protein
MTDFDGDSHYHSLPGIQAARIARYPKRRASRPVVRAPQDGPEARVAATHDEPHYEDFLLTPEDEQEVG